MQTMTRRQQQQVALRRDVLDAALAQLDDGGSAAVNWRGLARAVGVSPSTLYTYFESIDALYTALILDVYSQMEAEVARHVEPTAPAVDRVVAASHGYRRFATMYPARFTLVFTDVLPGYAAPPGGPTVDAQVAVMAPLIDGVTEMIGAAGTEFESLSSAQRQLLIAVVGSSPRVRQPRGQPSPRLGRGARRPVRFDDRRHDRRTDERLKRGRTFRRAH